jgi:hypothetical protein
MIRKYTASAEASSRHPQDWGRAMAAALTELIEQRRDDGGDVSHEDLYGEDLNLVIGAIRGGVEITLSWVPEGEDQPPERDGFDI